MTIQGLTVSASPNGSGATVLTQSQANQLLQRLRTLQQSGSPNQTIKIQAIQTNPTTGAKQIVAIPIQSSASGGHTITVSGSGSNVVNRMSPMKVIKIPASGTGGATASGIFTTSSMVHNDSGIKVVKLGAATTSNARMVYSPQVEVH